MSDRSTELVYQTEPDLGPDEMIDVLGRSGLAARRPAGDAARIGRMLRGASLTITARAGNELVGVARALTDFAYCCYLSELAVDRDWQRKGVGRELVRRVHQAAGEESNLVLLAAPGADAFYDRCGLVKFDNAWGIRRSQ